MAVSLTAARPEHWGTAAAVARAILPWLRNTPRGTVVKICGKGGCIVRVVNDYGPQKKSRVVDLYRPDFFAICGCPSYAGTTQVTVYVY